MAEAGWIKAGREGNDVVWTFGGAWTIDHASALDSEVAELPANVSSLRIDLAALEMLDTAGAWLIVRAGSAAEAQGARIDWRPPRPNLQALLDRVVAARPTGKPEVPQRRTFLDWVADIGEAAEEILKESLDLLAFFGALISTLGRLIVHPGKLRWNALIFHIEQTGLNALPIVGMISFLVGVVLAFQGADQLARFGAQVFTINMVGVSVLREMGILLTAIVVAGRSGSAFTAQIGTMQVNEEVDALRTIGLDPMEVLVVPRVLALMIALPLLAFFADLMGLLGGGIMSVVLVDVSFGQYWRLLNQAVSLNTFVVGVVKAPVFALLIALVGCFEGLRVSGSAESVGKLTTRAVVEGIFLVIIFDAIFSVLFSYLGI